MVERGVQEEAVNWKVLFKIGENWRNGVYFLSSTSWSTKLSC